MILQGSHCHCHPQPVLADALPIGQEKGKLSLLSLENNKLVKLCHLTKACSGGGHVMNEREDPPPSPFPMVHVRDAPRVFTAMPIKLGTRLERVGRGFEHAAEQPCTSWSYHVDMKHPPTLSGDG
jgi:hypothetical protein